MVDKFLGNNASTKIPSGDVWLNDASMTGPRHDEVSPGALGLGELHHYDVTDERN
jgi:hypothetical protein